MATFFPEIRSPSSNGDTISVPSSFLSAPHTPVDLHDKPFRPLQDDRTSLNMKKKHHRHREPDSASKIALFKKPQALERSGSDVHMLAGRVSTPVKPLQRSRSVEEVYRHSSGSISPTSVKISPKFQTDGVARSARARRWTLPSKSEATRGFTPLRSTVKQAMSQQDTESPAMITLRRATNNPTPRKSEITFFPEPTFSHEKNGLLSYLISTFSRASTLNGIATGIIDNRRHSSRSASVDINTPNGTVTLPAATVCTETTVDASLTIPGAMQGSFARRRCSTKYTSGSTVYEIIWDENDSISTGDDSSRQSLGNRRRSSLAVLTLEAQLSRSKQSSRRESQASSRRTHQSSVRSVDMFPEQVLTIGKLDAVFPRLLHKTGLRDLPRSRASRQRRNTVCSITVEEAKPQTVVDGASGGNKPSMSGIDFFPPLRSRKDSGVADVGWNTSDVDMGLAEAPDKSYASPVASGQTNRRSSSHVASAIGIFRQSFRQISQGNDNERDRYEDDRQPLLR